MKEKRTWNEQNVIESTDFESGEFDWEYYQYLCDCFPDDEFDEIIQGY